MQELQRNYHAELYRQIIRFNSPSTDKYEAAGSIAVQSKAVHPHRSTVDRIITVSTHSCRHV